MELQPIQNVIYKIRSQYVMLDFDLAALYEVETRRLKEQVRRNIERFPEDFMFQLSKAEWNELVANCDKLPENIKYSPVTPNAFTQEGVSMLSGVLRSPVAIRVNIRIMRTFVIMRNLVLKPSIDKVSELQSEIRELKRYVEDVFADYNDINEDTRIQLELINQSVAELQAKKKELDKPRNPIGFNAPQYKERDKY